MEEGTLEENELWEDRDVDGEIGCWIKWKKGREGRRGGGSSLLVTIFIHSQVGRRFTLTVRLHLIYCSGYRSVDDGRPCLYYN